MTGPAVTTLASISAQNPVGGVVGYWPSIPPFNLLGDGVTPNPNVGNYAVMFTAAQYAALAGTQAPSGYQFPTALPTADAMANAPGTQVYVSWAAISGSTTADQNLAQQVVATATPTFGEDLSSVLTDVGISPTAQESLGLPNLESALPSMSTLLLYGGIGLGALLVLDKVL
jgi:hypothetical protein